MDPSNEPPAPAVPKKPPVLTTVTFLIVMLIVGVLGAGASVVGMLVIFGHLVQPGGGLV